MTVNVSRLAHIEGNSHYGRGNTLEQIKEIAEFEEWCKQMEAENNSSSSNVRKELADRIAQGGGLFLTTYAGGSGQFMRYNELPKADVDMILEALAATISAKETAMGESETVRDIIRWHFATSSDGLERLNARFLAAAKRELIAPAPSSPFSVTLNQGLAVNYVAWLLGGIRKCLDKLV